MTNKRALELLLIEMSCVKKGSGMKKIDGKWVKIAEDCDRNCVNCTLVQKAEELLEMYEIVVNVMTEKVKNEGGATGWRKWQVDCDPYTKMEI